MSSCESCGVHATAMVMRRVDVALLGKLLQQQQREGRAAVQLIESAGTTPSPRATEPGKGQLVDVVA